MYLQNKNLHFTGIGGIGMCGLAELLHNSGCVVTGSDWNEGPEVLRLKALGLPIFSGHKSSHVGPNIDILVYSSAIRQDNAEIKEARRRGLPVIHRAEALAEMMRLKQAIVVAGSHGKTTTTAFLASIFQQAKQSPTVVAGGRLDLFQSTARWGKSKWFIAESDESDGSFHHLFPELIVLTNIDDDHIDFYGSLLEIKKSFAKFLKKIPFYGSVSACGDDPHVREVVGPRFHRRLNFYGLSPKNDFVLKKESLSWRVFYKGSNWGLLNLPLKGEYNALNALGAMVCAWQAGLKKEDIFEGLKNFQGVKRRRELKGTWQDILFYDDYAHHPVEINALLLSLREEYPTHRIVVLFQPHRYTRFKNCWDRFLKCFKEANQVFVLPVYPAGEEPLKGFDSQTFVGNIQHPQTHFLQEKDITPCLSRALKKKDVFVTLGAGSVFRFGENLLKTLKNDS